MFVKKAAIKGKSERSPPNKAPVNNRVYISCKLKINMLCICIHIYLSKDKKKVKCDPKEILKKMCVYT